MTELSVPVDTLAAPDERSPTPMGITRDMTPQQFLLECITENHKHFIVIGWTGDDLPVVVKESPRGDELGHKPFVMQEPVRYLSPSMHVSIEGEVDTTVSGTVSATVAGLTHDDAVKVRVTD